MHRSGWLRPFLVTLALSAVLASGVAGCSDDDDEGPEAMQETTSTTASTADGAVEEGEPVRFGAEVYEDPAGHLGEEVTVSGEIVDVLADGAFRLGDNDRNVQPLPVVALDGFDPAGAEDRDDDLVKVTGRVEELDTTSLREEHGLEYDPESLGTFVGQPTVLATAVEWLEGAAPRDRGAG